MITCNRVSALFLLFFGTVFGHSIENLNGGAIKVQLNPADLELEPKLLESEVGSSTYASTYGEVKETLPLGAEEGLEEKDPFPTGENPPVPKWDGPYNISDATLLQLDHVDFERQNNPEGLSKQEDTAPVAPAPEEKPKEVSPGMTVANGYKFPEPEEVEIELGTGLGPQEELLLQGNSTENLETHQLEDNFGVVGDEALIAFEELMSDELEGLDEDYYESYEDDEDEDEDEEDESLVEIGNDHEDEDEDEDEAEDEEDDDDEASLAEVENTDSDNDEDEAEDEEDDDDEASLVELDTDEDEDEDENEEEEEEDDDDEASLVEVENSDNDEAEDDSLLTTDDQSLRRKRRRRRRKKKRRRRKKKRRRKKRGRKKKKKKRRRRKKKKKKKKKRSVVKRRRRRKKKGKKKKGRKQRKKESNKKESKSDSNDDDDEEEEEEDDDDSSSSSSDATSGEESNSVSDDNFKALVKMLPGGGKEAKLTLCYRRGVDAAMASTFHDKCDDKGASLTIIKSHYGFVFGGYTPVNWGGHALNSGYNRGYESYLFSDHGKTGQYDKYPISNVAQSMYNSQTYGPTFGGGHDIHVNRWMSRGYCNPSSYRKKSWSNWQMAGHYNRWNILELEVYIVTNNYVKSKILPDLGKFHKQIMGGPETLHLCYSKTVHGGNGQTFHSRCNHQGPTITIIKTTDTKPWVFGGFTPILWRSRNSWGRAGSGFLFTDRGSKGKKWHKRRLSHHNWFQYATYDYYTYGPTFGNGHDLYINGNMNQGYTSPTAYRKPNWSNNDLAGSHSNWRIAELEVYVTYNLKSYIMSAPDLKGLIKALPFKTKLSDLKHCYVKHLHGDWADTFHSRCNHHGPSLTIIRSQYARTFGGFIHQPWNNWGWQWAPSKSTFIFTDKGEFRKGDKFEKYYLTNPSYSFYGVHHYGPTFGNGHDIHIQRNMRNGYVNRAGYADRGWSRGDMAGAYNFEVQDVEVLLITSPFVNKRNLGKLMRWIPGGTKKTLHACYKRSIDGTNSHYFHDQCNHHGPSLTLLYSIHKRLFGGYTPTCWRSDSQYRWTPRGKSFIFTDAGQKGKYTQYKLTNNNAIYAHHNYGPTFGSGHDIYVEHNMMNGHTSPSSYRSRNWANSHLAGVYGFRLANMITYIIVRPILDKRRMPRLKKALFKAKGLTLKMCFKTSIHGGHGNTWKDNCDFRGATLTVAKLVNGRVVGGYVPGSWTHHSRWHYCQRKTAFIFSDRGRKDRYKKYYKDGRSLNNCWYSNNGYGPTIGAGHDLHIQSRMDRGYQAPSNFRDPNWNRGDLAGYGSSNFFTEDIEMYVVLQPIVQTRNFNKLLKKTKPVGKVTTVVCFKKGKDGGHESSINFHRNCDNRGPTLTIITSQWGTTFGGYNAISWDSSGNYKTSKNNFIFTDEKRKGNWNTYNVRSDGKHASYNRKNYGPTFGNGHDIHVDHYMEQGSVNSPHAYPNYNRNSIAGKNWFWILDIEVHVLVTPILSNKRIESFMKNVMKGGQMELCYKKTEDAGGSKKFHKLCDGKGMTLTFIKSSEGPIFGGFNPKSWTSKGDGEWTTTKDSFIFTDKGSTNGKFTKYKVTDKGKAAYNNKDYGPTFGEGHDIFVNSQLSGGHANPSSYGGGEWESSDMAGSYDGWTIEDIEVYIYSTLAPTKSPTNLPTESPTPAPSNAPSISPTKVPSKSPTKNPSKAPSRSPTPAPSLSPTRNPTKTPTRIPTQAPSKSPTTGYHRHDKHCYKFHGAQDVDEESSEPYVLPLQKCRDKCSGSLECGCFAWEKATQKCWIERGCIITECDPGNGKIETYLRHTAKKASQVTKKELKKCIIQIQGNGFCKKHFWYKGTFDDKKAAYARFNVGKDERACHERAKTLYEWCGNDIKNPVTALFVPSGREEAFPRTKTPTKAPSRTPTKAPTKNPSKAPSRSPSQAPSRSPTKMPTKAPSRTPTQMPTKAPSRNPTKIPTKAPSRTPTRAPSVMPTLTPTVMPSRTPTATPTIEPTSRPTLKPTPGPTWTYTPTRNPTQSPTRTPTSSPTRSPSFTRAPSSAPKPMSTHPLCDDVSKSCTMQGLWSCCPGQMGQHAMCSVLDCDPKRPKGAACNGDWSSVHCRKSCGICHPDGPIGGKAGAGAAGGGGVSLVQSTVKIKLDDTIPGPTPFMKKNVSHTDTNPKPEDWVTPTYDDAK